MTERPLPGQPESSSEYLLVNPVVPPVTTGLGTGGLVSGIGSIILGLGGCCWWPFATLPIAMGVGAVVLGYLGIRQVAMSGGEVTGRSTAIAAVVTGAAGVLVTVLAVVIGLVVTADQGSFL